MREKPGMTSLPGKGKTTRRTAGPTSCETVSWAFLERRLRLAQSRFLQMKRDGILYRLLHVWGADTPGRWLEAMSLMPEKIRVRSHASLAEVARRIGDIESTKVGTEGRDACSDLWGKGRGMVGLLRFYDLSGSKEALETTKRIAGLVMDGFPRLRGGGYIDESAISVLEAVVDLFRVTQESDHLSFAHKLAGQVHPLGQKKGHLHLHSYTTALRGLLSLFEVSEEQDYLRFVMQQHKTIEECLLWPSGGLPEMSPDNGWGETCQTADWLRLNLKLGQITSDKRFFDLAETTLLNHLAFAQKPEGGFTYGEDIYSGTEGAEGWACCNMSGARAMQDAWSLSNRFRGGALVLNLYGQMEMQLRGNGRGMASLSQRTRFPDSGDVELVYESDGSHRFPLLARIPGWSPVPEVRINGERVRRPEWENGYVVMERNWKDGDRVRLRFPMLPRLKPERPKYGATVNDGVSTLWLGPRLLACPRAAAPREYQQATVRAGEIRVASRGCSAAQFRRASEVKVNGKRLAKALVFDAHQAVVRTWLGGRWERFRARVGLAALPRFPAEEDKTLAMPAGEVVFEVLLDGAPVVEERLGVPGTTRGIDVDLRGRSEILLVATAIQGTYHVAEFMWANGRLVCGKERVHLADLEARQVPSIRIAGHLPSSFARGSRGTNRLLVTTLGEDGGELRLPLIPLGEFAHQPMPDDDRWVDWIRARDTERRWDIARWTLGDEYCIWFRQVPDGHYGDRDDD